MADPVAGAEHAAGGAGAFLQKRVGPLPLWAWAGGVGVAFLALRVVGGKGGGTAKVTGTPAATLPAPSFSPGGASGSGSFVAPSAAPAAPIINIIIPGFSQPNGVTSTVGGGVPSGPGATTKVPVLETTPKVTIKTSGVGSAPFASTIVGGWETLGTTGGGAVPISLSADAIKRGGIPAKDIPANFGTPNLSVPGSNLGGTSNVITNGTVPFYTNNAGVLTQGEAPSSRFDN